MLVSVSDLSLFFPYYLTYTIKGWEVSQVFITWFYAIIMGWLIANALTPYTHVYPISVDQVFQRTTTVEMLMSEIAQRIEKGAVMQNFGFSPSLIEPSLTSSFNL